MMIIGGVGFTGGAAIGGFISAFLIPRFGWRSVLYFGGAVPLVIALAMLVWLPESLQFLVVRRKDRAEDRAVAHAHRSDACRRVRTSSSSCARRAAKECRSCISFARAAAP